MRLVGNVKNVDDLGDLDDLDDLGDFKTMGDSGDLLAHDLFSRHAHISTVTTSSQIYQ